jgi:hypothetical protein
VFLIPRPTLPQYVLVHVLHDVPQPQALQVQLAVQDLLPPPEQPEVVVSPALHSAPHDREHVPPM